MPFLSQNRVILRIKRKIGLTDSTVDELKNHKSVVNFDKEGCTFHL